MEKSKRGFGSMDPGKQKQIASKGGIAAHQKGRAHEFTSEQARLAGAKGGAKISQNREHMSRIGSLGGAARAHKVQQEKINKEAKDARTAT